MSETLTLKLPGDRSQLDSLTAAIEGLADRERWSAGLTYKVILALEEVVLNVMDYGYDNGQEQFIEVTVDSGERQVTIDIVDSGKPFDPTHDAPKVDVDAPIEDRPVGGLGVHLVRNMMDAMTYQREGGHNHLTLVANRE